MLCVPFVCGRLQVRYAVGLRSFGGKGKRCLPCKAGWVLSALGDVPPAHRQSKNRHQMISDRQFVGTLFEPLGLKNVTVFWPQNLRHF